MGPAKRRRFRVQRSWFSPLLIAVLISVGVWLVIATVLSARSDWSLKDWHLVLGDFVFFAFGFILALYHEHALDRDAELTTALGDSHMVEKIVVVGMHHEKLRECAQHFKDGKIQPDEYESKSRAHALSLFGAARGGLALFRYARPVYQREFAAVIRRAVQYAVAAVDLDYVRDVAAAFAEEAQAQQGGHGGDSSEEASALSRDSRDELADAADVVRRLLPAVKSGTLFPSLSPSDATQSGSMPASANATPTASTGLVIGSTMAPAESSAPPPQEQPPS